MYETANIYRINGWVRKKESGEWDLTVKNISTSQLKRITDNRKAMHVSFLSKCDNRHGQLPSTVWINKGDSTYSLLIVLWTRGQLSSRHSYKTSWARSTEVEMWCLCYFSTLSAGPQFITMNQFSSLVNTDVRQAYRYKPLPDLRQTVSPLWYFWRW